MPTSKTSPLCAVVYMTVYEEEEGQRLDNFLIKKLKGVPRSHIYRIIRAGEVRVNKGRVAAMYNLQAGDIVRIPPIRLAQKEPPALDRPMLGSVSTPCSIPIGFQGTGKASAPTSSGAYIEIGEQRSQADNVVQTLKGDGYIPIIFEDDAIIVLNKPFGMAVHGGSGINFGVIELLRTQRQPVRFMELVHRLDRETSGLLLVAKKRAALTQLHEVLREGHGIDKRYLAMVSGVWPYERHHIKSKLLKFETPDGERRVKVSDHGLTSHTIVHRRQYNDTFSLLECELKTGRTHQIRVHLAHAGYPVLGDSKYGHLALNKTVSHMGLKRMFLHAWQIAFKHPLTGEPLKFEAPLPAALQFFLDRFNTAKDGENKP